MKQYPSIQPIIIKSKKIYAFDKLDGSNIRAEWSIKRGFYKFGTRKRLLGADDPLLGSAIAIILSKYGQALSDIFVKNQWKKAVCFFEFFGENSFAGNHEMADIHDVILLDINSGKGLLEPKDFIKKFGHLEIPKLLYTGNANSELIEAVKSNTLENMTFEGVVCKGKYVSPGLPLMFKIKSQMWLDKLKLKCQDDTALFDKLV